LTAVAKRIPTALATLVFGTVLAACTLSTPPASQAAGTPAAHALGGMIDAAALPTAVVQTSITKGITDTTIGRYGTRTKATFTVSAVGSNLRYKWDQRPGSGQKWKKISGAKSRTYVAKATTWASGTQFRVTVSGKLGAAASSTAKLTVLFPTKTPAKDAEKAFGLTGITQGVDLSAYQYTPSKRVNMKVIASWVGKSGFTMLRNGSGARPVKQSYTSACTNKSGKTGSEPVTEDCAYARLADASHAAGLSLGHYWFNGWISTIDTTSKQLFAGGYTPEASAEQFVEWLKSDGRYTKASTDPLVLDIEAGHAWTKTYKGKKYTKKLRAWNPAEATAFLTTVRDELTGAGYHPNLYVYMSANAASKQVDDTYVWTDVAPIARLWVASWGTNNARIPTAQPNVGPWTDQGGWSIWQYTSNARISKSGVGALDGDIAKPDAWTPR
jgi:hypothetical protein